MSKIRYLIEWTCMTKSVPWTEPHQPSKPPSIVKSGGETWIEADDEETACEIQATVLNHSTAICRVIRKEKTIINENKIRQTQNRKKPENDTVVLSRSRNQ